jgi:hypothetical protein
MTGSATRISAIVLGTSHEFQRRQDLSAENEQFRDQWEQLLRETIVARCVEGIAKEAGDDTEVWNHLKAEEASIPDELRTLFGGTEIVDAPQRTIASLIAEQVGCAYADVRAHGAEEMTITERDQAMAHATVRHFGTVKSVMVIVGEGHRQEVARILNESYGWRTESRTFSP